MHNVNGDSFWPQNLWMPISSLCTKYPLELILINCNLSRYPILLAQLIFYHLWQAWKVFYIHNTHIWMHKPKHTIKLPGLGFWRNFAFDWVFFFCWQDLVWCSMVLSILSKLKVLLLSTWYFMDKFLKF
jgi:hypothetical protein